MLKSQSMFLCLCYFIVSSYGNLAPFIDKCEWSDKACLVASSQKAIPYFANGLPEFGVQPLDPLKMGKVLLEEGELKVEFEDMTVTGTSKCVMKKVERDLEKSSLTLEIECPINVVGTYIASGKLLFKDVQGHGPFQVQTEKVFIAVEAEITTIVGGDGQKHWKLANIQHTYDFKEKTKLHFDNLFNGDKEQAAPILTIFDQNWKDLMQTFGKPIALEVINKIMEAIQAFLLAIPASELEK